MPSTKNENSTTSTRLQLSATQLAASALAAVTATIAASYLGVNGTVIGAAIASVLTVTGNAVYGHSLHRTTERVRSAVPTTARWLPPARNEDEDGDERAQPNPQPRSQLTRRLAIASVGVFAAVLALVTSVELVAGRPLSDVLRGKSGHGTTVFGPHQAHDNPTPTRPAPTVTQTVIPKIVVTTPTVTHTAPPVTTTATPTVTPPTSPTSSTPPSTAPPTGPAAPTA